MTGADVYFTSDQSANNVDAGFGSSSTNAQLISCTAPSSAVGGSGTYAADYDSHCDFAGSTTFGPSGVPGPGEAIDLPPLVACHLGHDVHGPLGGLFSALISFK